MLTPDTEPVIVGLLENILSELRLLRALQERQGPPRKALSRADLDRLGRLLPVIAGAMGSDPFLAAEVLRHNAPGLQLVSAGLTARQLGKLFKRADGRPAGGYLVERLAAESRGILWRVMAVVSEP